MIEAYTVTDPRYTGKDAVTFIGAHGRFYPVYCHESAPWQPQIGDIARNSVLGFFFVNLEFYKTFASRILKELNERGEGETKAIVEDIFETPSEPD